MHKSQLTGFISKYAISKIDSVAWEITQNELKTKFISDDKSMIGEVILSDFKSGDMDGSKLGIYTTAQLLKLLSVLEDDISLSLNKLGDKIVSIKLNDHSTKINYALADLAIIPTVPVMKYVPKEFELVLKLDSEFINTYLRAKASLPDVVTFRVVSDGSDVVKIILGQTDVNTNTITLNVDTTQSQKIEDMYFNADIFADILSANKDCESELEISSEGIGRIKFNTKEYKSLYYLVAKKSQ